MGECHDGARNVCRGFPDGLVILVGCGGILRVGCPDGAINVCRGIPDRLVVLICFGGTLQVAVKGSNFHYGVIVGTVQFHPSPIILKSP